ncbi:MAG TPA: malto-oligosyltrehalose trehalohydrolase [Steroidobacteraceae bacterium]|jgi:malto-oligosyltrehalose trehalohydrolase|nr:malto-oligosyltrehalose trehalohydrolase [Steroidobacteraceae bacterium]
MNQARSADIPRMGARRVPDGGVEFVVWAPALSSIGVRIAKRGPPRAMESLEGGWWKLIAGDAHAGDRYCFVLDDGCEVPDPASRFQPDDVHGMSEIVDPRGFLWRSEWQGRRWEELVLYEVHIGTFTEAGTFRAAIGRLDHLAKLGITALQVMPVADFPGARNWGYDGVLPYAPDASYGRPEDFKALIDAAHARGIAVLLDVVYNHFGPEGNYLPRLAPAIFTNRHRTPWGAALNYDDAGSEVVREFVIRNACYWIDEFRLDGLRLDAVHAICDDSDRHLLDELAERVRAIDPARQIHLVLENEHNESRRLQAYRAQWNDDFHHVLHVAATGEAHGYYASYHGNTGGDPGVDTAMLARTLAEGFAFQGEVMVSTGRQRGEPSAQLPPTSFVAFIQNHDHIGNRAFGERIGALASPDKVRAIAAVYLLSPEIPMLFMGEEWDCRQPFLFFCDFHGELAEAVRLGRRDEFKRFPEFTDSQQRLAIPDPQLPATFFASKIQWNDLELPAQAARLAWYRRVLANRHQHVVPLLPNIRRGGTGVVIAEQAVLITWQSSDGAQLRLAANFSPDTIRFPADDSREIWHEGAPIQDGSLAPWTVRWTLSGQDM